MHKKHEYPINIDNFYITLHISMYKECRSTISILFFLCVQAKVADLENTIKSFDPNEIEASIKQQAPNFIVFNSMQLYDKKIFLIFFYLANVWSAFKWY